MKVLGVPHIAIIPFTSCNFSCSYCCANRYSKDTVQAWASKTDQIIKFLNSLDKKAIMVSGGEPLIWNGWSQIIKNTDHYWCFATNTSVIPAFLQDSEIKKKVKLFISAFHREFINIDKFIKNAHKLQDLGYPVFCKIVYTRDTGQLGDRYEMFIAGLPVSLTPLVGAWYSEAEAAMIAPLCDSTMYAERFHNKVRKKAICPAGTTSFEIRGMNLVRCGLQDIPVFSQMAPPQFLKKLVHDEVWNFGLKALHVVGGRRSPFLGTINNPQFYQEPVMCHRKSCDCEWHTFSEMGGDCPENKRWDDFIKTGKWV